MILEHPRSYHTFCYIFCSEQSRLKSKEKGDRGKEELKLIKQEKNSSNKKREDHHSKRIKMDDQGDSKLKREGKGTPKRSSSQTSSKSDSTPSKVLQYLHLSRSFMLSEVILVPLLSR